MVSTRGVKLKFSEGEKVLCYEPDPAKTKVLYNSKVLSITVGKDESGKRLVEFLIHFQGWNSTWDRFVTEDYVLKDTEENRQLQRELAEKAQLTAGGNLYKQRKKRRRKLSERISESLEAKRVCESPSEPAGDSDPSTSGPEDDIVPIHLSDAIKRHLELDYRLVTQENKLSKLPCTPNVVTVLENFFKYWATKQLNQSVGHNNADKSKDADSICRKLNLCKEVCDGLRIYFDFTLGALLLYRQEKEQYRQAVSQPASSYYPNDGLPVIIKAEITDSDYEEKYNPDGEDGCRKKSLRSSHKTSTNHELTNGKPHSTSLSTCSGASTSWMAGSGRVQSPRHSALYTQIQEWKIVPSTLYSVQPSPPSLIYGATHLARLFVKLPELLQATNMPDEKLETVLEYFGYFLKYLEDHPEWFGVSYYKDNPDSLSEADH
ncbi:male-specific lethal 3 homolog [Macrosteles quadrilineatus]|uniref:male-specific lethal 3 homolog n=1 Tax=Macrosteles quadrilineatus TaxID=74068 RepID=UPI0023E1A1D6|nr:male-specific lethal 3 homolog [Macrosteles quadrilineatus]